jgi:hypothetical protein
MRIERIKLALMATIATLAFASHASAQTPYDGLWQVTVVTKTGSCEASKSAAITIADGVVQGGGEISGKVSRDGIVKVSMGQAYAQGRLEGNAGSGKWNAASAGVPCSGYWEAAKQ